MLVSPRLCWIHTNRVSIIKIVLFFCIKLYLFLFFFLISHYSPYFSVFFYLPFNLWMGYNIPGLVTGLFGPS
jgi:hypothetical protein